MWQVSLQEGDAAVWRSVEVLGETPRSGMKNNDGSNIRTSKILLVLLPSHRLSASVPFLHLLLPPILLPLGLGEVNRATSS